MLLVGKKNNAIKTTSKQSDENQKHRKNLESMIAKDRNNQLPKSALDMIEKGNHAAKLQTSTAKKSKEAEWSDIPKVEMTPELATDLKILQLRNFIDPKHFYKTKSRSKLPTHFHIGTVVEGSQEFYSSRLTNKERKSSFVDELLANKEMMEYAKKKSSEIITAHGKLRKQLKKKKLSKTKFRAQRKS